MICFRKGANQSEHDPGSTTEEVRSVKPQMSRDSLQKQPLVLWEDFVLMQRLARFTARNSLLSATMRCL